MSQTYFTRLDVVKFITSFPGVEVMKHCLSCLICEFYMTVVISIVIKLRNFYFPFFFEVLPSAMPYKVYNFRGIREVFT